MMFTGVWISYVYERIMNVICFHSLRWLPYTICWCCSRCWMYIQAPCIIQQCCVEGLHSIQSQYEERRQTKNVHKYHDELRLYTNTHPPPLNNNTQHNTPNSQLKSTQNSRPKNNPQKTQSSLRNTSSTTIRGRRVTPRVPSLGSRPRNISRRSSIQLVIAEHIAIPRAVIGQTVQQVAEGLLLGQTVEAAVVGVGFDRGRGAAFVHDRGGIVVVGQGAGGVLGWEDVDAAAAGGAGLGGGGGGCCGGHFLCCY